MGGRPTIGRVLADHLLAVMQEEEQHETPVERAGKALGCGGPLTLERLVCDPQLGALTASSTQRALVRALDGCEVGGVLTTEQMVYHFGTARLPSGRRPRVAYLETGVRAGKTLISVLTLLLSVLTCRYRRPVRVELGEIAGADGLVGVRPGELVRAVIVGPKKSLGRSPMQHLIGTMQASPRLRRLFAREPQKEQCWIRRPDGNEVLVELVAADADGTNLRSTWLAGAIFDEAAFHDADDAAVNLGDELRAARPRMLADAQILVPSSPSNEGTPFDVIMRAVVPLPGGSPATQEQLSNGELMFHSDSLSMNPTLDRDDIAVERRKDPDNAAREYDAIPIPEGAGNVFYSEDELTAAFCLPYQAGGDVKADVQRWEGTAPCPSYMHFAGGDMGLRKNSSALVIARSEERGVRMVFRLELKPRKGAPLAPSEVVREFAFWCMRYGAHTIQGDEWYADTVREELGKLRRALEKPADADIEQRAWVARVKADPFARSAQVPIYVPWSVDVQHVATAHTTMRTRMQEGQVWLPADERLKGQARGTRRRLLPSGQAVIVLPTQGLAHGDVWGAAVIACTEAPVGVRVADAGRAYGAGVDPWLEGVGLGSAGGGRGGSLGWSSVETSGGESWE